MTIRITCKNGHKLNAKDELEGRTVRCPKCNIPVTVEKLVLAAEVTELEAFPFESIDNKDSDPFSEPFAEPAASTSPGTGQAYGYAMPNQVKQVTRPSTPSHNAKVVGKRVDSSSNKQSILWKYRFAIAGIGLVFGLTVTALLILFSGPSNSQQIASEQIASEQTASEQNAAEQNAGNTVIRPKLIESELLREAAIRKMAKAMEASGRNPKSPEQLSLALDSETMRLREELYPEIGMVTEDTEERLRNGKPDPSVLSRIKILTQAFEDVLKMKVGVEIDPSSLAPVEQELELQQLALSWRGALLQLQSIDEKQWSALQKVEEDVFGPASILKQTQAPEDATVMEAPRLIESLRLITIGVLNFESINKRFPTIDGMPVFKKGLLSWRVAILPMLGYKSLYEEFHLDEPWDSEHNKSLIPKMPKEFKTPGVVDTGFTAIHAIQGQDCVFGLQTANGSQGIASGLNKRAFLILGGAQTAKPWTSPDGFPIDFSASLEQLGTPKYRLVVTGSGVARTIPPELKGEELHKAASLSYENMNEESVLTKFEEFKATGRGGVRVELHLRNLNPTKG
jgi:hypothetical protein